MNNEPTLVLRKTDVEKIANLVAQSQSLTAEQKKGTLVTGSLKRFETPQTRQTPEVKE